MITSPRILIVAPHPDDEVLGVGGTILRRKSEGAKVAWLIVTEMAAMSDWGAEKIIQRSIDIKNCANFFGFDNIFELNFPTTELDRVPMSELVTAISNILKSFEPTEIFCPHPSDVHTDHQVVFNAVASSTKWFRCPSVRRVLAYETLSETDFNLSSRESFRPNVFVDIENYLSAKLEAMEIYTSEVGEFPFPRSREAITALARYRGAAGGFKAAEAFELLRERF